MEIWLRNSLYRADVLLKCGWNIQILIQPLFVKELVSEKLVKVLKDKSQYLPITMTLSKEVAAKD